MGVNCQLKAPSYILPLRSDGMPSRPLQPTMQEGGSPSSDRHKTIVFGSRSASKVVETVETRSVGVGHTGWWPLVFWRRAELLLLRMSVDSQVCSAR